MEIKTTWKWVKHKRFNEQKPNLDIKSINNKGYEAEFKCIDNTEKTCIAKIKFEE